MVPQLDLQSDVGRSFYIITALVGFLAGVGLYLVIQPAISVLLVAGLICVLLLVGDAHVRPVPVLAESVRPILTTSALIILAVCCGLLRASFTEHRTSPSQIDFYNGQKVEVEGIITETDIRRDKAKYKIRLEYVIPFFGGEIGESRLQANGEILISLNKYPQYEYGDRVRVSGKLEAPGEFDGFSYSDYLSRYDIYSVMYYPKVTVISKGEGSIFWRYMSFLQNKLMERINQIFPEPHASFEAGLLVGARKGIPDELIQKFNITGLTHIIAISGYNITIIIMFVMWILRGLPRKTGFIVAVLTIILFVLFVGASPSVVRAGIMGILGLIALNYGRQNNIHITVLLSAFFMILWNPKILWWDVGFQLSFAAVLGLIYVSPLFEDYVQKLPQAFGIREALQMTISAQIIALPIIIYNFGRLSLIAPFANLLVIFAIPPAMMFGFLAVLFSLVFNEIGLIFGYITWGVLSYIIKIIEILSSIPYASVNIKGIQFWMMFGYYGLLALCLYKRHLSLKIKDQG